MLQKSIEKIISIRTISFFSIPFTLFTIQSCNTQQREPNPSTLDQVTISAVECHSARHALRITFQNDTENAIVIGQYGTSRTNSLINIVNDTSDWFTLASGPYSYAPDCLVASPTNEPYTIPAGVTQSICFATENSCSANDFVTINGVVSNQNGNAVYVVLFHNTIS